MASARTKASPDLEFISKSGNGRDLAAAAESNVIIFSDDLDATKKLVDKIERLKKRQGVMKGANHLIRKADREGLSDLGFSEETIAKLFAQFRRQSWLSQLHPREQFGQHSPT